MKRKNIQLRNTGSYNNTHFWSGNKGRIIYCGKPCYFRIEVVILVTILTILDIVDLAWSIAASQDSKNRNKNGKSVTDTSGWEIDGCRQFAFKNDNPDSVLSMKQSPQ